MNAMQELFDREVLRRLDGLQARIESLEAAVFEPASIATDRASARTPGGVVEPSVPSMPTPVAEPVLPAAGVPAVVVPPLSIEAAVPPDPLSRIGDASWAPASAMSRAASFDEEDATPAEAEPAGPYERVPAWRPVTPAPAPGPLFDVRYLEERLAGRALALVGGAALILGAVFFLSLAFSRGWISHELQVLIGIAGGSAALLIGGLLLARANQVVGHVLTAVGLAVISLSLFAATNLYELVDPAVGLIGMFVTAVATAAIAIRTRSQVVAAYGLVAVLAAPPVLGASPDLLTVAYIAAALVGVALISLWQSWPWLPPLAFALSAPQLLLWLAGEPSAGVGAIALIGYWAVLVAAATGHALRSREQALSVTSAPLFMAVGAFVVLTAFWFLPDSGAHAAFLFVVAALHGGVSATFMLRRGVVDPFGLLAAAYGVAMASTAVPLVAGASLTAVVWASEAAALAVVAGRRAHGPSLISAFVLLTVAAARVVLEAAAELRGWDAPQAAAGPVDPVLAALLFFLAAAAVFVVVVPARPVRLAVVGIAVLACLPVVPVEATGLAAVTAWTTLAVVAVSAPRWLALLPERTLSWQLGPALEWLRPTGDVTALAARALAGVGALAASPALLATTALTILTEATPWPQTAGLPFTDEAGLCALVLAIGCLAAGFLADRPAARPTGIVAAGAVIGVAALVQLTLPWSVVLWTALALLAAGLPTLDPLGRAIYAPASGVALVAATIGTALVTAAGATPWPTGTGHLPFVDEAGACAIVLAVGYLAAGNLLGVPDARRGGTIAALAAIGIAAIFQLTLPWSIALWVVLALVAAVLARLDDGGRSAYLTASLVTLVAATAGTLGITLLHASGVWSRADGLPFTDEAGLCAIVLAAGYLAAGLIVGGADARRRSTIAALAAIGLAAIFQLPLAWAAALWCALGLVAAVLATRDRGGQVGYLAAAGVAFAAAAGAALVVAPPDRLIVERPGVAPHPLFVSPVTLAFGALAIGLAASAWLHRGEAWARTVAGAAGVSLLYLLSVGIVDIFAGQVGGPPAVSDGRLEVLAKEAQLGLSILWTVAGFAVLGVGLLLRQSMARLAGLAVLGLATAKVFVFDLSSLDVAYRVVSLIVLGLLLVVSAYAWTRRVRPVDTGVGPAAEDEADPASPASSATGRPDTRPLDPPAIRPHAHRHHAAGGRPR